MFILETSSKRLFDICRKRPIDVLQMSKHSLKIRLPDVNRTSNSLVLSGLTFNHG